MKHVDVVAAVITDGNKVLAAQRGYGELKGRWEFPGGKIEAGENDQEALIREIQEEMNATIKVGKHLVTVDHRYPKIHITLKCYHCTLGEEKLTLKEHTGAEWHSFDELNNIDWCPADKKCVEAAHDTLRAIING